MRKLRSWHGGSWLFAAFGVGGLLGLSLVGSGVSASAATGLPKTINIGVLGTVTGPAGGPDSCESQVFADQLAASTANSENYLGKGVRIRTIVEDDQGTESGAVLGYQKLVSQHVVGLEGMCLESSAVTIAPKIDPDKLPTVFSGETDPALVKYKYGFQGNPPQESFDANTIKALAANGVKTVSVIYTSDQYDTNKVWNDSWKPELKKLGIKVLGVYPIPETATNISSEIAQIQQEKPDAIGLDTYVTSAVSNAVEIHSSGLTQPLFGQIITAYSFFQDTAGVTTDGGIYYSTDFAPTVYGPAKTFGTRYQAAYHVAASPGSAQEYDGAWRLIRAIKSANSVNPVAIQRALSEQTSSTGVEGHITYVDGGHKAIGQGFTFLVKNEKLTYQHVK